MANLTIVVGDGTLKKARMRALEEDKWRWTALIYGEKFEEALTYAARLHRTQIRKGTNVPYVTHLLAVAAIVGEYGGTEDEVIAALLHDAVEDQGGAATREEIRKRFGAAVATIVDGTSDTDVIPKPPWLERKRNYVAHVSSASRSVRLVSAADKLHNARSILRDLRAEGEVTWQRFSAGREDQLWYYRALVDAFRTAGGTDEIVDELEEVVEEISGLHPSTVGRSLSIPAGGGPPVGEVEAQRDSE